MVNTRSQSNRESRIEQTELDTFSDGDSNSSLPDFQPITHFTEDYGASKFSQESEHEKVRNEQRFIDKTTDFDCESPY